MTQADQHVVMENFRSGDSNILVATSVAEEGLDVPACNFVIRFQHVSNEIATAQTQGRARAEESEVITILSSDSSMYMKEIQNFERLELVNKIVKNNWFPKGKILHEKLRKQQTLIIRQMNITKLLRQQRLPSRSGDRERIKLRCRKCKTIACFGSDIYTAEGSSHHVVPGEEIKDKLVKKPHHKPGKLDENVIKTHKIHCKVCDADWGIMCIWPVEGFEFPVLKCKSFVFQHETTGSLFPVAQWSRAPFEPLPLDVWIAEHFPSPDSDTDFLI
ncbi:antiviral innate immune response receptor RIG-I-like [Halichondria panicea]|uniref:antiviral innate immune response receptor RIG-I-like n=1 Tax=Halichondria panicea TaxID=6063 RepID=UPI00312B5548